MGSLARPIGVLGEIEVEPRDDGRVAPARSGLPPLGLSERGRSEELLCGRDELLLEDGLPLEEVPDVERAGGRPLEGRPDEGRDPLEGGRSEAISILHSE